MEKMFPKQGLVLVFDTTLNTDINGEKVLFKICNTGTAKQYKIDLSDTCMSLQAFHYTLTKCLESLGDNKTNANKRISLML